MEREKRERGGGGIFEYSIYLMINSSTNHH